MKNGESVTRRAGARNGLADASGATGNVSPPSSSSPPETNTSTEPSRELTYSPRAAPNVRPTGSGSAGRRSGASTSYQSGPRSGGRGGASVPDGVSARGVSVRAAGGSSDAAV